MESKSQKTPQNKRPPAARPVIWTIQARFTPLGRGVLGRLETVEVGPRGHIPTSGILAVPQGLVASRGRHLAGTDQL